MNIEVYLLKEGRGIEFKLSGTVHGVDIIEVHLQNHTPEIVSKLRYKIVDKLQVVENYISAEEITAISRMDIQVASCNPDLITAVVAPGDLLKMMAEVWKARVEDSMKHVRCFNSCSEAEHGLLKCWKQRPRPVCLAEVKKVYPCTQSE